MKWIFAALMLAISIGPVWAATSGTNLKRIERELDQGRARQDALNKKAANYGRELRALKVNMVKVAKAIRRHEADALALENRLSELRRAENEKETLLQFRRSQFSGVLMALERMASNPPEAMIAVPQSPTDTIRSAILLRTVVPEIERRVRLLRGDLDAVIEARAKIRARSEELVAVVAGMTENRRDLKKLMVEKSSLKRQTDAQSRKAERRIRKLAGKAKNLRDLMVRLEANRREQAAKDKKKTDAGGAALRGHRILKSGGKIMAFRGKLPFPAIGRLVGRYGQMTESGLTRKGITIETRPGAQVVAPYGGQVMFAGAFKGYGQLLIISHGGGYHSLLAGLSRIDSVIGQQILSGEPAGIMGGSGDEAPILYMELRRNGQPINPLPWLAARKSKVNG